jgi:hypothetical protein
MGVVVSKQRALGIKKVVDYWRLPRATAVCNAGVQIKTNEYIDASNKD